MVLAIDREMFSGSVDAGFILAQPFHHGDLEPDSTVYGRSFDEGGLMHGIKIPLQAGALKMPGGLMREGGGGGRICGTLR